MLISVLYMLSRLLFAWSKANSDSFIFLVSLILVSTFTPCRSGRLSAFLALKVASALSANSKSFCVVVSCFCRKTSELSMEALPGARNFSRKIRERIVSICGISSGFRQVKLICTRSFPVSSKLMPCSS